MKTLQNKKTGIPLTNEENSEMTTFSQLCIKCINEMPKEGLDLKNMSARLKILDVMEKAKKEIKLEDAQVDVLKNSVSSMRWLIMHKDIVSFLESVEKL